MRSAQWGCVFVELLMLQAVIGYAWDFCNGFTALAIVLGGTVAFCILSTAADSGTDYFSLRLAIREAMESRKRDVEPLPEQLVHATWAYAVERYRAGEPIDTSINPVLLYDHLKISGRLNEPTYVSLAPTLPELWDEDLDKRAA